MDRVEGVTLEHAEDFEVDTLMPNNNKRTCSHINGSTNSVIMVSVASGRDRPKSSTPPISEMQRHPSFRHVSKKEKCCHHCTEHCRSARNTQTDGTGTTRNKRFSRRSTFRFKWDADEDEGEGVVRKKDMNSFLTSFATYCRETSLHGWKYVAPASNSTGPVEKVTWFTLLIVALTTASIFVFRASQDFASHTTSTNMDSLSTSFDNLYFPAITVCNMNFMQRSVLEKYNVQNDTLIDIFDRMINTGSATNFTQEEIEMFDEIERTTNGSGKLKMEGHPKCHHMFLQYFWKNEEIRFQESQYQMHYRQTTDESVCCQIFPGILPWENNYDFDINNDSFWMENPNPWQIIFDGYKKGIKPGKQGVKVLIDVETYEYFSVHSSGSEGVLVLIQHYRDVPLMRKESFLLPPGFEVDVGLGITEITTTAGAISRFTPEQRDCYTADEVNLLSLPLKKGYRMSMKNCLYDKALHATKEECGCQPSFYKLGALGNLTTCTGTQLNCAFKIFDDVHHQTRQEVGTAQSCMAPCNDQIYDSRITMAAYPNLATLSKRDEICLVIQKLFKICHEWTDSVIGDELKIKKKILLRKYPTLCDDLEFLDEHRVTNLTCSATKRLLQTHKDGRRATQMLYEYSRDNLLWLNVYVKDSFATHIVRDERMTRTSFVANVGGLLGLCMGFSLVSVAEIIYFCSKRFTGRRRICLCVK